jgi:hypothetical protein
MILAGMFALNAITELLGARTMMSAPTPFARRAISSSIPSLKPTNVRTIVT